MAKKATTKKRATKKVAKKAKATKSRKAISKPKITGLRAKRAEHRLAIEKFSAKNGKKNAAEVAKKFAKRTEELNLSHETVKSWVGEHRRGKGLLKKDGSDRKKASKATKNVRAKAATKNVREQGVTSASAVKKTSSIKADRQSHRNTILKHASTNPSHTASEVAKKFSKRTKELGLKDSTVSGWVREHRKVLGEAARQKAKVDSVKAAQGKQDKDNEDKIVRSTLGARKLIMWNKRYAVPKTRGAPPHLRRRILREHMNQTRSEGGIASGNGLGYSKRVL